MLHHCFNVLTYYTGDLSCFYFESSVLANHRSQRFPVFRFLSADWPAAVVDGPGSTSWTQVEVLVLLWRVAVTVCSKQPEIRARQQCHIRVRASENMSTLAKREKIVSRCVTEASHWDSRITLLLLRPLANICEFPKYPATELMHVRRAET